MPLDLPPRDRGQEERGPAPRGRGPGSPGDPPPRRSLLLWVIFGLVVALVIAVLSGPEDPTSTTVLQLMGALAGLALVVMVGRGMGLGLGTAVRYLMMWVGIGATLGLAYPLLQPMLGDRFERQADQRLVASAREDRLTGTRQDDGSLKIDGDAAGHFRVIADVGGKPVRFLIDTGATAVALTRDDARRLGFDPTTLDFRQEVATANGTARAAGITLSAVDIGGITLRDVKAQVVDAPMEISLLGNSFLSRLGGYEVRGRTLVLKP